jgi:hypothetical protein
MAAFLLLYSELEKHQDKIQLFISDLKVIKKSDVGTISESNAI